MHLPMHSQDRLLNAKPHLPEFSSHFIASKFEYTMGHSIIMLCTWFFLFSIISGASTSPDSLAVSQSIHDGETLVSAGGITEVGFFSPGNSTRRYLGIWFTNISPLTVVWVANRNKPLENNSGVLKLNEKGILVLLNSTNSTIWSSNISSKAVNNPIAHLLDSGNFIVKNGQQTNEDGVLWQSFDYPGDTHLPEMKIGWNLETGLERYVSSWKRVDDPAEGEYAVKLDLRGYPQIMIFKGPDIKSRAGSWNGLSIVGNPGPIHETEPKFVMNEKEVFYEYHVLDRSVFFVYKLTPSGTGQTLFWTPQTSTPQVASTGEQDQCENYAFCGANSICIYDGNHPTCECLRSYIPKSPDQWNISIWRNGCVPRNKSNCNNSYTDGFFKYSHMKLPDTSSSWFNTTMNLDECQMSCLKNCSCTAYANLDIRDGGSGCLLWFNTLADLRKFSQWGQDLYIRIPDSELDHGGHGNIKKKIVGITIGATVFGLFITCVCILVIKNPVWTRVYCHNAQIQCRKEYFRLRKEDMDLPTYELSTIAKATSNFSNRNKLGEGGFGPVYKGTLIDGQEVAVKRNSKMSDQGLEEFKNEVALIANLQHRNLVKLLGCCIQGEEKLLIYEYLPNKSLDCFIFDEARSKLLAWHQRFHIIVGIARGLLYLHQDSRLRIIHRDLKTSNILLDAQMNPKISDFGNARTFGDQIEAKTKKVVGTYGYMPPEYAVHGHYSVKSDVFGFGVIILEIVSGNKNRGFSDPEHSLNLLGHAWRLWTEERPLELIDTHLRERCVPFEVLRCIHVGLLCVQQKPGDRPDMSSVIPMLNGAMIR
ncbi:G-type lectin S-receptor-like serine/threonine-protein kinase At4g27290 isoform X2 [Cajanus cajan]|uniref:G-type lectin S-receptor-like serine/threonine-protein kinase At4g27290 isoform X2 n=1 Tax=Cajanus cajan TaxID=3821 RepID=UPI0010FB0400|nr:G-type lectin S-receptor-like serine/threonine-protein kinase At4g27290 isoform X2 [Cajanus cajan]